MKKRKIDPWGAVLGVLAGVGTAMAYVAGKAGGKAEAYTEITEEINGLVGELNASNSSQTEENGES